MPSLVVIGPQIKEKQRGGDNVPPPAYMVPKDSSLNRVKFYDKFCSPYPIVDFLCIFNHRHRKP